MAIMAIEPITEPPAFMPATIEKVSIIVSKGSLDGIYPGLIMANGAESRGHRGERVLYLLRTGRDTQDTT